jgi:site-specific DNA recombinase
MTTKATKATKADIKRAVIYVRISLDKSGEGAANERQEERCRGLAVARGWDVVAVIDDTISASKVKASERPGWRKVLAMIEAGEVDVVVTYHLDRITRTMTDLEELILLAVDRGVGVATANGDIDLTTDTGRMVARILAAVARQEVERKGERQTEAAEQRARQGKPQWSTRPFGYERDGSLREEEAALVRRAYADVVSEASLASITAMFNRSGYTTTKAGQHRKDGSEYSGAWDTPTVRHILLSARNAAIGIYRGEEVDTGTCTWAPIVSPETYRAAVHILTSPTRNTGGGGRRQNLLTGVAHCAECGGGVKVGWKGGRKGDPKAYAVYVCRGKGCMSMPVEWADDYVTTRALGRIETVMPRQDVEADVGALRIQAETLRARLEEWAQDRSSGAVNRSEHLAGTAQLRAALTALEGDLAAAGRATAFADVDLDTIQSTFTGFTMDKQRAILQTVIVSLAFRSRGKGRIKPTEDHVAMTLIPLKTVDWPGRAAN